MSMAVDGFFEIAGKVPVKRCRGGVFFGQA
jgi:hypothetical protein